MIPDIPCVKNSILYIFCVSSLKNSENNDGLIIRLTETSGVPTTVTVNFAAINKSFELNFTSQEVKTIKLTKDGNVEEIRIIEQ